MKFPYKVGFLGFGNLAQSLVRGLLENKVLSPNAIAASNRSPGKLVKAKEQFGINTFSTNEDVIEFADVIILAMKPQDLLAAVEPIWHTFHDNQIVISLAAGISLDTLEKKLKQCRLARVIANTPTVISEGVFGYLLNEEDLGVSAIVEDLFSSLGTVICAEDEDQFNAIMISSSSGTGFILELMTYWQEWIEERGFDAHTARKITVATFLGTSMLADQSPDSSIEDMINKVASKKGVTEAGLKSMRELEIERTLRYSFEKADLKNQELSKLT